MKKTNSEKKEKLKKEPSPSIKGAGVQDTAALVRALYKTDEGKPFELSPSQRDIFDVIFKKQAPDGKRRIHVMTSTQFGKSETISMAVLTRASTFPEKWAIVAPTRDKAKIIMGYCIKHLFENEYTLDRFKIAEGENIERIRRERSARRITFNIGNNQVGEIFILSAESKLKNDAEVGNALMGFGAPNLVMDEASLISDNSEAKAMRMVGGFTKAQQDFVVKIGNPFKRNHFMKAFQDPKYYKIVVDCYQGIKEGRLTKEYIAEMREKPYFKVLYECKFPEEGEVDDKGWTPLLSQEDVEKAMNKKGDPLTHAGEKRIGVDVARGGENYTAWVLRSMNYADLLAKSKQNNTTDIGARTILYTEENGVKNEDTFIDEIGVGAGVVDSLLYL